MKHKSILMASEKANFPYCPKEKKRVSFELFDFLSNIISQWCMHSPFQNSILPAYDYLVKNKIKRLN